MILVTGGAGYIGSQLVQEIPKHESFQGETIRILDNMFRERYVTLWSLPKEVKFEFIEGDITKEEDVKRAMKDVHLVFHLAAITNAPLSFERKELTKQVNLIGTKNVLKHALKNNVERLVYSSTASVYGPVEGIVREDHECKPESPYGLYKLLGEKECIRAYQENGLKTLAPRLSTVYGYSIGMRVDTVVNRFSYLAATGNPLTLFGTGEQRRPFLHLRDAVNMFLFLITHTDAIGEIYNVVGQNASINEIITIIRKFIPDAKIKRLTGTKHLEELSYMLDDSRIRRLGYKTRYNLEEGTMELLDKFGR
ncbi:MAG: NAD-dependent epimerase/dehydratase family protein [Promethearchaeota archaeon]